MTVEVAIGDFVLSQGATLEFVRQFGVTENSGTSLAITIAGTLFVHASPTDPQAGTSDASHQLDAIASSGSGAITIASSGVVRMDASIPADLMEGVGLGGGAFVNHGLIDIKSAGSAVGVAARIGASPPSFENSGTITVTAQGRDAIGVDIQTPSTHVLNSGRIEVSGLNSPVGLHLLGASDAVSSGVIVTHDLAGAGLGVGVLLESQGGPSAMHFTNSGSITSDTAFASSIGGPFTASVLNSGSMVGAVRFADAQNTLTNTGSITGAINFGTSNDTYDGRQGSETGLVSGGAGNDTELGGAGFDNFQGNQGDDSLSGGGGDDIVVGGKDNDVQFGDAGDDVVWGNLGNDTLDGGDGNDQVRGGQGDDSVSGGAGNDYVSGDRGNDTETGGAGADMFHSFSGAGIDRVLDFHASEGDRVMLDPGTTYTVSQVGADTVVDMGGGDQLVLVGVSMSTLPSGWIFTG